MDEFLLTAFSTFFGAMVALGTGQLKAWRDARLKEEAALNSLVIDLASKRAFLVSDGWTWAEGELGRVTNSVLDARTKVREARLSTRPRSDALAVLRSMTRACNLFLETAERSGPSSESTEALKGLSHDLSLEVKALSRLPRLTVIEDAPGSGSLPNR